MSRLRIAEELLGCSIAAGGFAPCPGAKFHSKQNGKRDFRVVLDGAPTGYCFHSSCSAEVEAFNKELRRLIWREEHGDAVAPRGSWGEVAPEPRSEEKARPLLDLQRVAEFTRGVPKIDADWFRRRSHIDVSKTTPGTFLDALYAPDERVLIFTDQKTQGDFLWWVGRGGYRLGTRRGIKAVKSSLPVGTNAGVWYLVQPVTGQWEINPRTGETASYSRRSQESVTAWRYYVLESDELPPEEWLRVVANLPLPIAAIYTSGGRSVHALMMHEVSSKAEWDQLRNMVRQIACPLGADPAALSAVRLSRLPGCKRGDRLQELIYLNPEPEHTAIRLLPEVRE